MNAKPAASGAPQSSRAVAPPGPEPALFSQLVRDHYGPALRHAGRLLRNDSEAQDCVQEAFAEVFTQLGSLREPEAVAGWIRSIVRHRCLRRLRRRDFTLLPSLSDLDGLAGAAPPEERNERRAFARWLLELLPPHERELVTLFYLKECSQQEIATFLGLPLSTVNNRLHDARERMKKWEKRMDTRSTPNPSSSGQASRIGTLLGFNGPLVEARFDPDCSFDLFDALAVVDKDGQAVERLKVCHRAADGRVLCLPTGGASEALLPGTSLLNTGRVGLLPSPTSSVLGVSAETLLGTVEALRGAGSHQPQLLQTGIKAIDLLCPLAQAGVLVQMGSAGVGRIVLLDELAERLAAQHAQNVLCLADRSEPDPYRGWDETVLRGGVGGMQFYWALSDQGTDPSLAALDTADSVLYLSPILAVQGAYPAIDPEYSRSRLLVPEVVGSEHCQLAARAREALLYAKRAASDPVLLELLACRAYAAARRRLATFEPAPDGIDPLRLARARKLQRFLTQPFETARALTGWPGEYVGLEDTLQGCRAILDGEVDALPESAFGYTGTLEQVRDNARVGRSRVYCAGATPPSAKQ